MDYLAPTTDPAYDASFLEGSVRVTLADVVYAGFRISLEGATGASVTVRRGSLEDGQLYFWDEDVRPRHWPLYVGGAIHATAFQVRLFLVGDYIDIFATQDFWYAQRVVRAIKRALRERNGTLQEG